MLGAKRLLELVEPQDLGGKQRVVAHRNLCLGPPDAKHMSGGSQFAAAIRLLERVTGEPLIEASCQFRKSPKVGEELEIEIDHLRQGRSITQAGMSLAITCEAGAKISASLGKRDDIGSHQWWQAPNVPRAEDCEPLRFIRCDPGTSMASSIFGSQRRLQRSGRANFLSGCAGMMKTRFRRHFSRSSRTICPKPITGRSGAPQAR